MDAFDVKPSRFNRVVLDIFTLGLYEIWFHKTIYRVEGDRAIVARGVFMRNETKIPANKINAVEAKLRPLAGTSSVVIDTGAGKTTEAVKLSRHDAREFAQALRELEASARNGHVPLAVAS